MPESQAPEAPDETGPTCLYKDGESETFEGADVAKAAAEGWIDSPTESPPEPANAPTTPPPVPDRPKPAPKAAPETTAEVATKAAPEPASDG